MIPILHEFCDLICFIFVISFISPRPVSQEGERRDGGGVAGGGVTEGRMVLVMVGSRRNAGSHQRLTWAFVKAELS
uniref:Uncharacterized protein n=1 Tax=Oryza meridionalis TaxID=40149 RepID=A0A0E0EY40_9ORYZ